MSGGLPFFRSKRRPGRGRGGVLIVAVLALAVAAVGWWRSAGRSASRRRAVAAAEARAPRAELKAAEAPAVLAVAPGPEAPPARPLEPALPTVNLPDPAGLFPRGAATVLEAQIELARRRISSGSIDGVAGSQTARALRAFQESEGIAVTGVLDRATRACLILQSRPLVPVTITAADLGRLRPLSPTWLGKSEQKALEFATLLELVSERAHANPALVRQLNPGVDWDHPAEGLVLTVPAVERPSRRGPRAAEVRIYLAERVLQARSAEGVLLAHAPVSIARNVEKRPVGELRVAVVIPNPNYTFNPEVFPESAEGRELGRKLVLPPGPNNPVGLLWIGLDRPGYGIHGTPGPEQVGRTESHGCFRLANWDAVALGELVWPGMPVWVEE